MFRPALTLLIAVIVVSARLPHPEAQPQSQGSTAPPQSESPVRERQVPLFRGDANLVRVDAAVLDRRGTPVTTLTRDDFEITEDGIPQTLEAFRLIHADGQPTDNLSLPIRSRDHAVAEAARDEVRVFLILWDEYHIGADDAADTGRRMLTDFVKEAVGPTDLVGVMDQLTVLDAIRYTRDRDELVDTISWLDGRFGVYFPTRSVVEEAQAREGNGIVRLRAQVTSSAIRAAILHLGSLKDGRKTLILVTEGLNGLGEETERTIADLVRAANANNTAIHVINPARLKPFTTTGPFPDHVMTLTQGTGGMAIGPEEGTRPLQQIAREASAFYLLGYSSTQNPTDGRFHAVTVRVKRRDVVVRARNGYVAPSAQEIERARALAAAAERPPEVERARAELSFVRRDRSFDLWIGAARGPNGPRVTALWSARSASEPGMTPRTLRLVVVGADRRTYFDRPIEPDRSVAFDAAPGPLTVTATARNLADEWVGGDTRSVVIPDFDSGRIAIATPVVLRARNQVAARTLLAMPEPPPFAGREFRRTDRVFIRFMVYGADLASVSAGLLNDRGGRLIAVPVTRLDTGMHEIDVPLSSIATGDYLVSVEARLDGDAAQALVGFRVVP